MKKNFIDQEIDILMDDIAIHDPVCAERERGILFEKLLENGVGEEAVYKEEKPQRLKPSAMMFPLYLSILFLGGFFLGTVFGFFWGNREKIAPPPLPPFQELIEPLYPETGKARLAPQRNA